MDRGARRLQLITLVAIAVAAPSALAGVVIHSVLWTNVGWTAAALGAATALARAARRASDPDPGAWRLLVWAAIAWFAGQCCWDLWTLGLPLHVPADAGWLAFAILATVGLARVASFETEGHLLLAESIPVVAAAGALIAALLHGDIVASSLGTVEPRASATRSRRSTRQLLLLGDAVLI